MRRTSLITIGLLGCAVLFPLCVHALSYDSATTAALATNDTSFATEGLTAMIGTVIKAVLSVLGVVFLILTLYAGMLWMTAGGNADNVKKAKSVLVNSVIGLVLVLSSYYISVAVIESISKKTY